MTRRWSRWGQWHLGLLLCCGGALSLATGCGSSAASQPSAHTAKTARPAVAARTPDPLSAKPGPGEQRLFLFEVTREGLPTSYLHGSVHALRPEDAAPHPKVNAAFADSRALVVEVDISQVEPALLQGLTLQLGTLPHGEDLEEHLSAATWQSLVEGLPDYGLPLEAVRKMRPWLIWISLAQLSFQREGYRPEHGVDHTLLSRAHASPTHEVLELETAESQLRAMASLPPDIQDLMLQDALMQAEMSDLPGMFEAWQTGDLEGLAALAFASLSDEPRLAPLYEELFFKRNRAMADRLDSWLVQERQLFVVVGAAHLVGSEGVPALLAGRGYQVRQLTAPMQAAAVGDPPGLTPARSSSAASATWASPSDRQDEVRLGAP